ncbi:metal-sulfur cluster assembly factor [Piscinibacter sp.]|uniref:metal-sulfur cluster assembly factor n=1 Tax=Piscinibacter sp. TaxID=1903157 RepID=UPI002BDBFCE0|nr:iron-sulfur cluster assembly protein [Albitalea sp.]HUG24688.1 iron-sulfur cluster assembly protein [Albitalea sp.]
MKPDRSAQVQQVQACLATVMDPELDESVTELGFVTELALAGDGEVRIGFRLPTYWCAANFAFLMADDMRRAVQSLPWVTQVQVRLHEHMYAEAINDGVADGGGFQAAFGAAAEGGLDALRRTFLLKAFQRRQEALLQHLLDGGHEPAALVALNIAALEQLPLAAEGETLVERYLARRDLVGGADLAFVDTEGQAIAALALRGHLRGLRRVGVNAEFNGALCRGLLAVRDGADAAQPIHIVRRRPEQNGVLLKPDSTDVIASGQAPCHARPAV